MEFPGVYMVVFADFDEVSNGQLQLIASHGADYQGVQLSCQLPHVLFVCVHQTLGKRKKKTSPDMQAREKSEKSQHDLTVE